MRRRLLIQALQVPPQLVPVGRVVVEPERPVLAHVRHDFGHLRERRAIEDALDEIVSVVHSIRHRPHRRDGMPLAGSADAPPVELVERTAESDRRTRPAGSLPVRRMAFAT
jgi:hypothetical protein